MKTIFIGSDKSGFLLKEAVKANLLENGYTVSDIGTLNEDQALPYYQVAEIECSINDANVLCMGGWVIAPIMGVEMAKTFLNTSFTQNLEDWRAKNIQKFRAAVYEIEKASFHK